jgi:hypothetical protein
VGLRAGLDAEARGKILSPSGGRTTVTHSIVQLTEVPQLHLVAYNNYLKFTDFMNVYDNNCINFADFRKMITTVTRTYYEHITEGIIHLPVIVLPQYTPFGTRNTEGCLRNRNVPFICHPESISLFWGEGGSI